MEVPKSVQAIMDSPRPYLVATEIAKVLGISDATLRDRARAGMLEFPAMVSGSRVRFPKIPFLRWLGYEF